MAVGTVRGGVAVGVEVYLAWTSANVVAQTLYDRLTAIGLRVDLLCEDVQPNGTIDRSVLLALRAELAVAGQEARTLVDDTRAHALRPGPTSLARIVDETIRPLARHLSRREVELRVGEIPATVRVVIEAPLLKAAIAGAMETLLHSACAGETVDLVCRKDGDLLDLSLNLSLRRAAPERPGLLQDLAPLRALLEARGGQLLVTLGDRGPSINLRLPRERGGELS